MIFKNFKHGKGKCSSAINYLLEVGDREIAPEVVQGSPELTVAIADDLNYKHKYLSGVLSFNENLSDKEIAEIIKSFEEELVFPTMSPERYNSLWVKHQDKSNLELHYVIPSVDLETNKKLTPYFHRTDKHRWKAWQEITNDKYNLGTPDDPRRSQKIKIDFSQSRSLKDLKEDIKQIIEKGVEAGEIHSREDVLKLLLEYDVEITRKGKDYISLKRDNDKKAFRLKGDYFKEDWKNGEVSPSVYEKWKRERPQQIEKYRQTFMVGTEKRIEELNKRYIKKEMRIEPTIYTGHKRELAGHEQTIKRIREIRGRLSRVNKAIRSRKPKLERLNSSIRGIYSIIDKSKRAIERAIDQKEFLSRFRREPELKRPSILKEEPSIEYHHDPNRTKKYTMAEQIFHRAKMKIQKNGVKVHGDLKPLDPKMCERNTPKEIKKVKKRGVEIKPSYTRKR